MNPLCCFEHLQASMFVFAATQAFRKVESPFVIFVMATCPVFMVRSCWWRMVDSPFLIVESQVCCGLLYIYTHYWMLYINRHRCYRLIIRCDQYLDASIFQYLIARSAAPSISPDSFLDSWIPQTWHRHFHLNQIGMSMVQ